MAAVMPTVKPIVVDSLSLLSLKCASRTFDLSSRLAHVSMRDQIVRAQLLARDLKRFDSDAVRVLVVGAGVAGAAFAIEAAQAGLEVAVVEADANPLHLQSGVTTRFVGPFLYEWPSVFHDDQNYPPDPGRHLGTAPPLTPTWGDDQPVSAAAMATQFLDWLRQARHALRGTAPALWFDVDKAEVKTFVRRFVHASTLNFWRWMAGLPQRPMPPLSLTRGSADPANPPGAAPLAGYTPDYVVLAAGMGQENTSLPPAAGSPSTVSGRRFWEVDDLKDPAFADLRVGVFGGGDGALQDVLRLLTQFEHPLQLLAVLRKDAVVRKLLARHEGALLTIEQQSRLIGTWTLGQDVFAEVDAASRDVAAALASNRALRDSLVRQLRTGNGCVQHFVRDAHFGKAYLLNRFVVHLIDEAGKTAIANGEAGWNRTVEYRLYFGSEAAGALQRGRGVSGLPYQVDIREANGNVQTCGFDRVVVRLGLDQQAVGANQLIQLSPRDSGQRTAIAQVPLPFVTSR
ncbi:FAD-dependent oxidoreductase [Variovorax sp. J2P1-59]|uniref:FAD-dependent oxidoreductase n=1 Tax=Variovorax flavidus TaxID=3053501 RepID=UPI0025767F4B|nr:FAD-dependent oxidoreductase [Variovorax sp. J2P1-59]MDM0076910.1 FAD-dependent oxidoreductase [Variovorax sp. J2P1-59]